MEDATQATAGDILGIIQRRLYDLNTYLMNPPHAVDVEACKHHLAPVWGLLDKIGEMQATAQKEVANGEAAQQ